MKRKFWTIKNEVDSDIAEILLYGQISDESWWGDEVTPKQFADDLKELGGKDIVLRINSPGGDVFAAHAIYNQLTDYSGDVTVKIDGMCASAATIISCAGNKVIMPDNAIFMIHNPQAGLIGYYGSAEMQAMAGQLDTIKQTIVNVYNKRSTLPENKIKKMMDAETWMSAQEAKDNGFVDEIDAIQVQNSIKKDKLILNSIVFDMSQFKNQARIKEILEHQEEKQMDENQKNSILDVIKNYFKKNDETQQAVNTEKEQATDPVIAERQRIVDLQALDNGNELIHAIVDKAIKSGMAAKEVKEYVDLIEQAQAENQEKTSAVDEIKNLISGNLTSGAQSVTATAVVTDKAAAEAASKMAGMKQVSDLINNMRGVKK